MKRILLAVKCIIYASATWWRRLNGEIDGTPEHSAWGRVEFLYKLNWEFGGNDYTSAGLSQDRLRHDDVAQGHSTTVSFSPRYHLPICTRFWTVKINKVQYAHGHESSW